MNITELQAVRSPRQPSLKSSSHYYLVILTLLSLLGVLTHLKHNESPPEADLIGAESQPVPADMVSQQVPEGRPGNLTDEQEEKLRQLWAAIFQLCGVADSQDIPGSQTTQESTTTTENDPTKKKRFGLFRKNRGDSKSASPISVAGDSQSKQGDEDDKYGQTKQYHETLANHSPETIRETIWTMVKHDHPDALALRFLRARKWDVDKALVMLVSTMNWRHSEMKLDEDIMKDGEAGACEKERTGTADEKRLGQDFLSQIRMGKSFLHGTDKNGRPVCVVRVRLHKQGEQCEESLERYTVYLIETTRMVLYPPVDTAVSTSK